MDQYRIMLSKPGIFSRSDVGNMATMLNRRFGFKESEIPLPGDTMWDGDAAQMNAEDRIGTRTPEGAVRVRGSWLAGPEKRGGSSFSADGKGGFTRSVWDGNGNRVDQDGGTRAEGAQGRWKVLRSGFISDQDDYGTVYENDKTGETAFVRRGETPPWQKQTGGTDKMAIEQMKEDGRNYRAGMRNDTRLAIADLQNDAKLSKMKGDFEIRMRNAKNAEERTQIERDYKVALADHLMNLDDLGWVKFDESVRHNKATEENVAKRNEIALEKLRMKASGGDKAAQDVLKDALRLKRIIDDSTGKETEEAKANALSQYNALLEGYGKAPIKSGDNKGNGTQKTITGYRYNKDRTRRIPVYSDGTQGSVEVVPQS
jgi:hypothetical protein